MTGEWVCSFCKQSNINKEEYGDSSSTAIYPELVNTTVEYLDPTQQPFPLMGSGAYDPVYIFLIDLNHSKKHLQVRQLISSYSISTNSIDPSTHNSIHLEISSNS